MKSPSDTDAEWAANSVRVRLNGIDLIWLKDEDGSGALAPPEHVDETGNIKPMHCFSESYAHVTANGRILRYREQIGRRSDLEILDAN